MAENVKATSSSSLMHAGAAERTADYRDIYTNQTAVGFTMTDIQIGLATITFVGGTPINEQHATVYLAPAQAKFLALSLEGALEAHERAAGTKVSIPQTMLDTLKAVAK